MLRIFSILAVLSWFFSTAFPSINARVTPLLPKAGRVDSGQNRARGDPTVPKELLPIVPLARRWLFPEKAVTEDVAPLRAMKTEKDEEEVDPKKFYTDYEKFSRQ